MKEMLRMILDMDKQACARVQEAEAYRDKRIAELSEKKDEIVKEENQKALDFALKKVRSNAPRVKFILKRSMSGTVTSLKKWTLFTTKTLKNGLQQ